MQQRIRVLEKILSGKGGTIITTMGSCMDHLIPLGEFQKNIRTIRQDSTLNLEELKKELVALGYEREWGRWKAKDSLPSAAAFWTFSR